MPGEGVSNWPASPAYRPRAGIAGEAPVAAFRAKVWMKAGEALRKVERFGFALEQLEVSLGIDLLYLRGLREQRYMSAAPRLVGLPGHSRDLSCDTPSP